MTTRVDATIAPTEDGRWFGCLLFFDGLGRLYDRKDGEPRATENEAHADVIRMAKEWGERTPGEWERSSS